MDERRRKFDRDFDRAQRHGSVITAIAIVVAFILSLLVVAALGIGVIWLWETLLG